MSRPPPTVVTATDPDAAALTRRERLRARMAPVARRAMVVALAAEGVITAAGLWQIFAHRAAGLPLSRPGVIAAVAGAVAFVATLAAPVIRRRRGTAA